mgnify:CR=1 FL=1
MIYNTQRDQIVMMAHELDTEKDKQKHVNEYIKSLKALEDAMEPYKEQKRELRKEYDENNWLSKDEQRMAVRAYRLLKDDIDISQLIDIYESLKGE